MFRSWTTICAAALLLLPGALTAGKRNRKAGPVIVAHIASEAVNAAQLSLRTEQGWDILYVQSLNGDWTVLNVSHPEKPVLARRVAAANAQMKALGGSLALVDENSGPPTVGTVAAAQTHKLRLLDTSDPASPRPIPELEGASSYALDRVRGLLFLSNAAGLWIVHDDGLVDPTVKMWEDFAKAQ